MMWHETWVFTNENAIGLSYYRNAIGWNRFSVKLSRNLFIPGNLNPISTSTPQDADGHMHPYSRSSVDVNSTVEFKYGDVHWYVLFRNTFLGSGINYYVIKVFSMSLMNIKNNVLVAEDSGMFHSRKLG